jgi:uncharacterized protein (TIGR03435 family)
VDSVNEKPTANPSGTAEALPAVPAPTAFEVASVKVSAAGAQQIPLRIEPGGRLTIRGMTMSFLLSAAFRVGTPEQFANLPSWVQTDRYDIFAKAPEADPSAPQFDQESAVPMLRTLLAERFKLRYHTEDRQVPAWSLAALKPRLKPADPASRTVCRNVPSASVPQSRVLTCRNVTMAQFADRLAMAARELTWPPVLDATGLEGGWDFSVTYSQPMLPAGAREPTTDAPTGAPTIFEAVEKQLGLKLEKQKRPVPIIVIDRLEEQPTEN